MRILTILLLLFSFSLCAQDSLCVKYFSKEYVEKITSFRKKFTSSGGRGGKDLKEITFSASGNYGRPNSATHLDLTISETSIPVNKWKKTRLSGESEVFDLVKSGERVHTDDIHKLDNLILNKYDPHVHDYVSVKYDGEKLKAITESQRETKLIHEKVVDLYAERKGHYLKKEDLDALMNVDTAYPDQSVFALMKPNPKRLIDLSDQEFKEGVEATLTVVFSKREMYVPSFVFSGEVKNTFHLPLYRRLHPLDPKSAAQVRKKMFEETLESLQKGEFKGHIPDEMAKKMEASYRKELSKLELDPQVGFNYNSKNINTYEKLSQKIEETFGKDITFAEFTRFAKFSNISDEMFSKLILKGFKEVKDNGVDVILISADTITERHFRQNYGFKTLGEIETKRINQLSGEEKLEKEFVMYIRVDSAEFSEVVRKLQGKTKGLSERILPL